MRTIYSLLIILCLLSPFSCKEQNSPEKSIYETLEELPDSIQVGGITFNYGFKNRQHPENCVNEVRQKDRTFYIRLKNTQL
jgi:hypothetical protein